MEHIPRLFINEPATEIILGPVIQVGLEALKVCISSLIVSHNLWDSIYKMLLYAVRYFSVISQDILLYYVQYGYINSIIAYNIYRN